MLLRNILLVIPQLALVATMVNSDCDDGDCYVPLLRYANEEAFGENVQTLCLAKKSQGIKGLVEAQVRTAEPTVQFSTRMKFDVDCTRAGNNYQEATVKSCFYDDENFGKLVLPARSQDAERVLGVDYSGGSFDILINCYTKGAASVELVGHGIDPQRIRGFGPIHSVKGVTLELCIVNRGHDVAWGIYDSNSTLRSVIPVTYKLKCDGSSRSEIVSCAANTEALTGAGTVITLNAGTAGTTKFWYNAQTDNRRAVQYTFSCDKRNGAAFVKAGVVGNAVAPFVKPSQHKAQALKADEKPKKSTFFRLDK